MYQDVADVGRIIVFKNNRLTGNYHYFNTKVKEVLPKELKENSRFGFSVANIGDIHKDGLQDFAVGAPGAGDPENGAGAVFIFHGCKNVKFGMPAFNSPFPI